MTIIIINVLVHLTMSHYNVKRYH